MINTADSTREEPMHAPEQQKSGSSDDQDPIRADAQEIWSALEQATGNSPEFKKVKEEVTRLEIALLDANKKPRSGASSTAGSGSFVVVMSEDEPMNQKQSPKSKRPPTSTAVKNSERPRSVR